MNLRLLLLSLVALILASEHPVDQFSLSKSDVVVAQEQEEQAKPVDVNDNQLQFRANLESFAFYYSVTSFLGLLCHYDISRNLDTFYITPDAPARLQYLFRDASALGFYTLLITALAPFGTRKAKLWALSALLPDMIFVLSWIMDWIDLSCILSLGWETVFPYLISLSPIIAFSIYAFAEKGPTWW